MSHKKSTTAKQVRQRLAIAFKDLRHQGYFARQNFLCCQSCASAAIPAEQSDKAVFYHAQDADNLAETGQTYLAWAGEPHVIMAALTNAGLTVEWDGNPDVRILVSGLAVSNAM